MDRRLPYGLCTFLRGILLLGRVKNEGGIYRSSAELRALAQGITEAMWIKGVLYDFKFKIFLPKWLFF